MPGTAIHFLGKKAEILSEAEIVPKIVLNFLECHKTDKTSGPDGICLRKIKQLTKNKNNSQNSSI